MRIPAESTAAVLLLLFPVTWELAIGGRRYLRHHGRGLRHARSHLSHSGSKNGVGGFAGIAGVGVGVAVAVGGGDDLNAIPFEPDGTKTPGRLFVSPNHTVVLAQIGTTATLHCEVTDIGESTVTWIRRTDYQLLTVGLTTYSSDDRFFTAHGKNPQDWTLHLRFATDKDAGLYECQISTHPPTSLFVELQLVEAHADIVGGPDKIVKSGSPLRLTCVLRRSTEPPAYVFWYHGARMINFDLGGGAAVRHGRQTSELLIPRAQKHHAGNYSCVPSNARPASVNVHVLQGKCLQKRELTNYEVNSNVEKPAAMQHGSKNNSKSSIHSNIHQYLASALGTTFLLLICR